jgi:hypothetical protein
VQPAPHVFAVRAFRNPEQFSVFKLNAPGWCSQYPKTLDSMRLLKVLQIWGDLDKPYTRGGS